MAVRAPIQGDEARARILPSRQPMGQSFDGAAPVTFENAMVSIMQQDNIASPGGAQAINQRGGVGSVPIARREGPHGHAAIAPSPHDRVQLRPAITPRRAHPTRSREPDSLERLVAAVELIGKDGRRKKRERPMIFRVIFDGMAARCDFSRQSRKGAHARTDHEKGSMHLMLIEQIQQGRSGRRIGAVIEGEGYRPRIAGMTNRGPKQLRRRVHSRPGKHSRGRQEAAGSTKRGNEGGHEPQFSHGVGWQKRGRPWGPDPGKTCPYGR